MLRGVGRPEAKRRSPVRAICVETSSATILLTEAPEKKVKDRPVIGERS